MRRILFPLLIIGMAAGLFTMGSGAFFSDTAEDTGNVITAGTVDITLTGGSPIVTVASPPGMAPGDNANGSVQVNNAGTLSLRYAVTSTLSAGSVAFAGQLQLTIKEVGTSCAAFDGATLYGPAAFGGASVINLVGDPTSGPQAGDRTLAAGANETLCFRVHLPTTTDNTHQGATAAVTFTFHAEQTVNNP
jgi:predicted ribosomally synthesized peptide with SipW-like signal peptide